MRRFLAARVLAIGLLGVPCASSAQVGLAVGVGTTGLGGEVALGLGERLVVRGGAGISTLDVTTTFDGIPVELDLPRLWYTGGLDLYLNSAFRVGAGVIVRPDDVEIRGRYGDDAIDLGGQTLSPDQVGALSGVIEAWDQAPYALVGFGKHVAPGVGLSLDVGAAYFGKAVTTLTARGGTFPSDDLDALLAAEASDFDDEMKTYMEVWPLLRLAVRVGFGPRPLGS